MMLSRYFALLILIIFQTSCVGTVEDKKIEETNIVQIPSKSIPFQGVLTANGIAHNKIELYFPPAAGDPETMVYQISYDGLSTPESVNGSLLTQDYRGYLRYVINNLQVNTTYSVSVEVVDSTNNIISNSGVILNASTTTNTTADFQAIASVENLPGISGINGIKVKWPGAASIGTIFTPNEIDINTYEVTLLDSNVLGPADFDNTAFSEPDRKVISIAGDKISATVNGLKSETKYYVRVRGIHYGKTQNSSDPTYQVETNNKYLEISTFSNNLSNIDFDASSLALSLASGSLGLNAINTEWNSALGVFDHYRLYYNATGVSNTAIQNYVGDSTCSGQETNDSDYYCIQISFQDTQKQLTDLLSHKEYKVMLAVCQSLSCDNSSRLISIPQVIKTSPPVAIFGGINSISFSQDINELDYLNLLITPPDLSTGIMDGILIEYKGDDTATPTYLNHPSIINTSNLQSLSFDFTTASNISVKGINLNSNINYCFSLIPFYYDENGILQEDRSSEVTKCHIPAIKAPTNLDFFGLNTCIAISSGFVNLTWDLPTAGHYDRFEIYYKKVDANIFSFTSAIGGDVNYTLVNAAALETDTQIEFLDSGDTYTFGIITYLNLDGFEYRSELNSAILQCTIN